MLEILDQICRGYLQCPRPEAQVKLVFSDFRHHTPGPEALKFGKTGPTVQHSACPLEKKYCLMSCPGTLYEDKPTWHSTVPKLYSLTWALMHCLTRREPGHPDQHTDRRPHTEHIRTAMAFGHHLTHTSVFRLQNLDLNSNHCPGVSVMQKSEILLTHGKKTCVWHVVQRSV